MRDAWIVFNRSIYEGYQMLGTIIKFTILWWICMIPLFTFGPATAGLFAIIQKSKTGASVSIQDYFHFMKKFFHIGIRLSGLYLFVMIPGIAYIILLFSQGEILSNIFGILLMYILILWNLVIFYTFPLLIIQKTDDILILLKRALKLVTENYSFTLNIALYAIITTLICSVLAILLVAWIGLLAIISLNSLSFLLHKYHPEDYQFEYNVSWKGVLKPWTK
ncbi:DUF624 domain-containing protein [Sutcliffiella rhizosphaerae]|uniref:DUF624 domain-containing protein n=1 Tax=Sutcliffiella rhizosphaerae TaxID=2880967 RepID=A0ABM8YM76_9BACI|nr:DUF624 domain-containing protein [Sutcliffiella rhizosphaerae]CAG9621108.1 hypothetical protein BACCIP111883_01880 [Sutcliffiella rhizosphaerae]